MRPGFDPENWYWLVDGVGVYSSAVDDYVQPDNPTYVAWLKDNRPTKIASEADLLSVLDTKKVVAKKALAPRVVEECRRRIYAKVSETSQKAMLAHIAAGLFDEFQISFFRDGVMWITAMQLRARELIAAKDRNFKQDNKWPACPTGASELAKKYETVI